MERADAYFSDAPALQLTQIKELRLSAERALRWFGRISPPIRHLLGGEALCARNVGQVLSLRALNHELEQIAAAALDLVVRRRQVNSTGAKPPSAGTSIKTLEALATAINRLLDDLGAVEGEYWLTFELISQAFDPNKFVGQLPIVERELTILVKTIGHFLRSYEAKIGRPTVAALERTVFALMEVIGREKGLEPLDRPSDPEATSDHEQATANVTVGGPGRAWFELFAVSLNSHNQLSPEPRSAEAAAVVQFLQGIDDEVIQTAILNMIGSILSRGLRPSRLEFLLGAEQIACAGAKEGKMRIFNS